VISQLKCDGQKAGCCRCKASSAPCLYTSYDSKRETQRKHNVHQRTGREKDTLSPIPTSPAQQDLSNCPPHPRAIYRSMEETFDSMRDNQTPPYGDISMPSPNILDLQGFGEEDEQIFFNSLLPNPLSNDDQQGQNVSALDISHLSPGGVMEESMKPLKFYKDLLNEARLIQC